MKFFWIVQIVRFCSFFFTKLFKQVTTRCNHFKVVELKKDDWHLLWFCLSLANVASLCNKEDSFIHGRNTITFETDGWRVGIVWDTCCIIQGNGRSRFHESLEQFGCMNTLKNNFKHKKYLSIFLLKKQNKTIKTTWILYSTSIREKLNC